MPLYEWALDSIYPDLLLYRKAVDKKKKLDFFNRIG
jgi:hypothetical protein